MVIGVILVVWFVYRFIVLSFRRFRWERELRVWVFFKGRRDCGEDREMSFRFG